MVGLVAGGVHTIGDVNRVVGHTLNILTNKPAIALLCGDTLDFGSLGLDVVGDGIHIERGLALCKLRTGGDGSAIHGVGLAVGVDILVVEVDVHKIGLQGHIVVGHITLLVDVDTIVSKVVEERVGSTTRNHLIETRHGIASCHGVDIGGCGVALYESAS